MKKKRFLVYLPPFLVFFSDFFMITPIKGRSMAPQLNPNTGKERDIALVWRPARPLRKNDIVVFTDPFDSSIQLVKRVAALPGDVVINPNAIGGTKRFLVPEGRVWLMADNIDSRNVDSRTLGPVPQGLIQGRMICLLWPLSRIQWFSRS